MSLLFDVDSIVGIVDSVGAGHLRHRVVLRVPVPVPVMEAETECCSRHQYGTNIVASNMMSRLPSLASLETHH